ncbi:DNA repair protein RAD51 -like protein 4 [Halotydeus destructor]|nr:DNA repair protein RAD51 -like protein 4 [Halotydeus destructor]
MPILRHLSWIKDNPSHYALSEKLCSYGLNTVEDLLWRPDLAEICTKCCVSPKVLIDWRKRLLEMFSLDPQALSSMCCDSGRSLLTGCSHLDQLLHLKCGEVIELTGPDGSGKSHFSHQLALELALCGRKVLYIDSDATFSSEKLVIMLRYRKIKAVKQVLSHILVSRVFEVDALFDLFETVLNTQDTVYEDLNLIVIDSISSLFDVIISEASNDRSKKVEMYYKISLIAKYFHRLSSHLDASILVNKQNRTFLGQTWKNCITHSVKISKHHLRIRHDIHEVELLASVNAISEMSSTTLLSINSGGFTDYVPEKNLSVRQRDIEETCPENGMDIQSKPKNGACPANHNDLKMLLC